MRTLTDLLADVLAAVQEAGDIIRNHAEKPRNIAYKGRIDLVTATDVAVEEFLRQRLATLLPGAHFLAEEGSPDAPLEENTWIIDPIDGTTNFAHGLPFVATSIGLWQNGEVILGVVNAPLIDECFSAIKGGGAYRNNTAIRVSSTETLERSLVATGFPYAIEEELPGLLGRMGRVLLQTRGIRRYGAAALDLAYVAAGKYEGFYERCLNPWDMAAGWLLVREAGGVVSKMDGLPFTLVSHEILATNGKIHDELQKLMYAAEDAFEA